MPSLYFFAPLVPLLRGGFLSVIESHPENELIHITTEAEQFVLERIENHGRQKEKHKNPLTHDRDTATYVYHSKFEDTPQFNFTAGWARSAYSRIDRVMEKDLTASGLNDFEWKSDWKDVVEGKLPQAIKDTDTSKCSEGHNMTPRFGSHTLCMACGEVKWPREIT